MARTNKIKRLPKKIRDLISRLREDGATIDEILAKLRELDVKVARSTLGEHLKRIDQIGELIHKTRASAEAVVSQLEDAPEGRVARLNIELAHALLLKLMMGEDGVPVTLDPRETMFAATAIEKLTKAEKLDAERILKLRQEFAKKAADAVDKVVAARGLTAETVQEIKAQILGLGR